MKKDITDKMLSKLEIESDEDGFSVWITEKNGQKHWLIDGSTLMQDGSISLGQTDIWKHKAVYDKEFNIIKIIRK